MLFKIMLLIHIFILFFSQANTLNKYQINLEKNDIEMNLFLNTNSINIIATKAEKIKSLYNPKIPMPKEHQDYLFQLCNERNLNYYTALAVINHESSFDCNNISETRDYGYFQINLCNHETLSKVLNTKNEPLDPYININWGTYFLSVIYNNYSDDFKDKHLDDVVLSIYNKGENGFKKSGMAESYLKLHNMSKLEIFDFFKEFAYF